MKEKSWYLRFFVIGALFVAGCEQKRSDQSAADVISAFTAAELAELTEFQAWKMPIPQAEQALKKIRLVIVRDDGTVASRFDTGELSPASAPWSFMLLAFRAEGERFKGHLWLRQSKGISMGLPVEFKDEFANSKHVAWIRGAPWNGNRAQIGSIRGVGQIALELVN